MTDQTKLEVIGFDEEIKRQREEDTRKQFQGYADFYKKVYDLELDFEDPVEATAIIVPPRPAKDFNWLHVVPRYVDERGVLQSLRETYEVQAPFQDPLRAIGWNARSNKKHGYAIWLKHRRVVDKDLRGLSAVEVADRGISAMTLLERLLLEDKNRFEGNKPLDPSGYSLLAGTRFVDDTVPTMGWMHQEECLRIRFMRPETSRPFIGARQVVESNI